MRASQARVGEPCVPETRNLVAPAPDPGSRAAGAAAQVGSGASQVLAGDNRVLRPLCHT